jgi:hypothetical protein
MAEALALTLYSVLRMVKAKYRAFVSMLISTQLMKRVNGWINTTLRP